MNRLVIKRILNIFKTISRPIISINHSPTNIFTLILKPNTKLSYDLEKMLQIEQQIEQIKCSGCGIQIQMEHEDQDGYIDRFIVLKYFQNNQLYMQQEQEQTDDHDDGSINDQLNQIEQNQQFYQQYQQIEQEQDQYSLQELLLQQQQEEFFGNLEKQNKLNQNKKQLVCQRCYKIRKDETYIKEQSILKEHNEINESKFKHKVLSHLRKNQIVLYIVDVMNLSQTLDQQVLQRLQAQKQRVMILFNKSDCLPSNFNETRLRQFITHTLNHDQQVYDQYYLISAKTGMNVDKLLKNIEKIKETNKQDKAAKQSIYVIGNTNSGKSTLLNKMMQQDSRYKKIKTSANKFHDGSTTRLTESKLPGTTIDPVQVKLNIGFKVFDTPGFPITINNIQNVKLQQLLLITKKISARVFQIKQKQSLLIGGLVNLEHQKGNDIDVHVYCSMNVNMKILMTDNLNIYYFRQYGKMVQPVYDQIDQVQFKKHSLRVGFDSQGKGLQEIEIPTIGIVGFSYPGKQKSFTDLVIYLEQNQQFTIRDRIFPVNMINSQNKKTQVNANTRMLKGLQKVKAQHQNHNPNQ